MSRFLLLLSLWAKEVTFALIQSQAVGLSQVAAQRLGKAYSALSDYIEEFRKEGP